MPADRFSRMLSGDEAFGLVDRSPLAIRVFLAMFWGGGSERCGVARAKPGELADDLKSSRRAIVAALHELAEAKLISYSESEQLAYRPGFALHFKPAARNNWVAWRNSAMAIRDGLIRTQVLEDLGSEPEPSSRPSLRPSSEPSSTPKTLETLETLETNKNTIPVPYLDQSWRTGWQQLDTFADTTQTPPLTHPPRVLPAAQVSATTANADRTDAELDELFRAYHHERLYPHQPVAIKRKAGGEDAASAVLARQIAAAAIAVWNDQMSPAGNPVCRPDRDWHKRNARNVAKAVAAAGGIDGFRMLVEFAANEMPYYAGKPYGQAAQVRAWTMPEWCARATIEKVQAGLNSWVVRETGQPSVVQLDWTRKPVAEHLGVQQ